MTSGPLPTTLIFLTELPLTSAGSKVRFLGWYDSSLDCRLHSDKLLYSVIRYVTSTGMLHLQHARSSSPLNDEKLTEVIAIVDISLLLSTLKTTDLQCGEWLNVIGYVGRRLVDEKGKEPKNTIRVQAVMAWSAGAIDLGAYEKALIDRMRPTSE